MTPFVSVYFSRSLTPNHVYMVVSGVWGAKRSYHVRADVARVAAEQFMSAGASVHLLQ